jgi:hypothetical protein
MVVTFVPLKIIGYGYLPEDDALRHAAKAVSGKSWDQILVMRSDAKFDNHPGWHATLGFLNRTFGWGTEGLVIFSIAIFFTLFCLVPIFFLRRPEALPLVLLIFTLTDISLVRRLFFGRPYILTMAVVLVICFIWPRLKEKKVPYGVVALIILLTALATLIHGSWYLFALPVACFFLARQWRAGTVLAISCACGIALGALCTGHPYLFLKQQVIHVMLAFSNHAAQRLLVSEFQSFTGDTLPVVAILGMLAWRYMRGDWDRKAVDNPVFILVVVGWALGFVAKRFWFDWSMPAMCVWMAMEFDEYFDKKMDLCSWSRAALALAIAVTFYLAIANDAGGRWSNRLTVQYLSADNPEQAGWLPDKDGIIYSDDMTVFYETFFKNPKAPWRYVLGFEPALMMPDDLAIFRKIQWNYGTYEAYGPWVKKMKPADRLVLRRLVSEAPNIPGLEWHYAATGTWVGRLPRGQKAAK